MTGYSMGRTRKMLPVPSDPNYTVPELSEDDFFHPKDKQEDDALLATGAWVDASIDNPDAEAAA